MVRRLAILWMSLGLWTVMLAAPSVAQASSIYSNFGAGFSYDTSNANPVGFDFFTGDNDAQGSSFVSGVNASVSAVEIALSSFNATNTDAVTVSLRSSAAGLPDGILESWTIGAGALGAFGSNNAPLVLLSVVHPLLSNGIEYWLTASGSATDSVAWNLNNTGDLNPTATSVDGGGTWNNLGLTPGAFEVDAAANNVVPEPGSLVLLASGLALAGRRLQQSLRRRKKSI